MSNTITAFSEFSPNTLIKSSQVNANFANFRGHRIPIDPNTAAGSDNTYDLGSSEYRWLNAYISNLKVDKINQTITSEEITITASYLTLTGLGFNSLSYTSAKIPYEINRVDETESRMETGELSVWFKNTATGWQLSQGALNGDDSGVLFDITSSAEIGYVVYTGDTMTTGSYVGAIRHKRSEFIV